MAFRGLISIIARVNLEMIQMNAVNAFMNCQLDEVIYMRQLSDFKTENIILQLRKILYELKQSSLLWQRELTSTFRDLEFKEISQKSCIMINEEMIVFFYVDNIVIYYRKKNKAKA